MLVCKQARDAIHHVKDANGQILKEGEDVRRRRAGLFRTCAACEGCERCENKCWLRFLAAGVRRIE